MSGTGGNLTAASQVVQTNFVRVDVFEVIPVFGDIRCTVDAPFADRTRPDVRAFASDRTAPPSSERLLSEPAAEHPVNESFVPVYDVPDHAQ